jgi:ATP-dependent Clp protease adapter protein ClpS
LALGEDFKKHKEDDPTFKMFICCNKLPAFDDYDNGIARRINIVEFSTKFCDNPKKKYEKQLVKYTNDEKQLLSIQLNHLLIKQYINLHSSKFSYSIPLKNKELHSLYLNDNNELMNQVQELLQEHYEYSPNRADFIKLKDVKQLLKQNDINIKDNVSIKNFVEDIFEGVEYKERVTINTIQLYKVFTYIKIKK